MLSINAGDLDFNLRVDGADFLLWQRHIGQAATVANLSRLDHDASGVVDQGDLTVWEDHWGDVYATPANTAPTLGAIADRAMSVTDDLLSVPLELQDAEGDFLQIVARVTVANPLAEIRDAYGLSFRESYLPNLTGLQEKWLFGTGGAGFLLLPNGDLVQWQNSYADTAQRETLIARLDAAVYEDPSLLWNAAAELPAPANAYVDGNALIVDPHEGVVGDLIVRVGVSDGLAFSAQEFVVSVSDDQPTFDEPLALLAHLQTQAAGLTHDEFPEFRQALAAATASLDGVAAARAYDLLRQLDAAYEQADLDAQASVDWERQEERRLARELESAQFVEQELEILLNEFNGAWTGIRDSIDDVALPPGLDPADIPPIFIHGKNPAPLSVEQGHEIEFDVRAIHPFGAPRHYFDSVDGPGESFVSVALDEDTGVVRWTPWSDNPPGAYTFVFGAEAYLAARPEDYPGFEFYDGGGAYAAAITTVVIHVTPAEQPVVGSLHASPRVITDSGTDPVVLTALGVTHDSGVVDFVRFWQDRNGNETYEYDRDLLIGFDVDGADGWSIATLPDVPPDARTITVYAQAVRLAGESNIVKTTIEVIPSIQLPDSLVSPLGRDASVNLQNSYRSSPLQTYFSGDDYVSVSRESHWRGDRILAQWFSVSSTGVHTPLSASIVVYSDFDGETVASFDAAADAQGNLVVVVGIHGPYADEVRGIFAARPPSTSGGTYVNTFLSTEFTQYLPLEDAHGNPVYDEYGDRVYEDFSTPRHGEFMVNAELGDDRRGFVTWDYDKPWRNSSDGESIYVTGADTNFVPFDWSRTGSAFSVNANPWGPPLHQAYAFASWGAATNTSFGARSLASISNNGKMAVLWPASPGTTYLGTANYGDWFTFRPLALSLPGTPTHIAVNDDGWMAIGVNDQFVLVSPGGAQVGPPTFVNDYVSLRPTSEIARLEFDADGTLAVDYRRGNVFGYVHELFRFAVNPAEGVFLQSLVRVDAQPLDSGGTMQIDATIRNEQTAAANNVLVAFYLSHDGNLDAEPEHWRTRNGVAELVLPDRIVGFVTFASLAAGSSQTARVTLTLPSDLDPFWQDGSANLQLIGSVSNSGSALGLPVPSVTAFYDAFGADEGRGFGQPQPQTGVYIRPNIAAAQVSSPTHVNALDQMELIGRQLASGLRMLERQAPGAARERLRLMRIEVDNAMDAYFQKKFDAAVLARESILFAAANERNRARLAAETLDTMRRTTAEAQRAARVDAAHARIAEETAAQNAQIAQEEAKRAAAIAAANRDVAKAEAALAGIQSPQDGFALGFFDDLADGAAAIGAGFQTMLDDLLETRDRALAAAQPLIDAAVARYHTAVNAIEEAFVAIVAPFQQAIERADEWLQDRLADLNESLVQAFVDIEQGYQDAVATADEVFGDALNTAKQNAVPLFDALDDKLGGAIQILANPTAGISAKILGDLLDLPANNPLGTATDILSELGESSAIAASDSLAAIATILVPPVSVIVKSGGDFVDWAEETGGAASDWVAEGGETVADWVEDNVGDLLAAEAVAYKIETDFELTVNMLNGSIYANAEFGPGLSYDLRKIKELTLGEVALPDFDPLAAIDSLYGATLNKTTDYETVKAQQQAEFGASNVYFASSRFVEYFGAETLSEAATEWYLGNFTDALKETAEQLRLELNDVLAFLQLKGEAELASLGANILNAILHQTDLVSPHVELRWTPVNYRYELELSGLLGQAYDALASEEDLAGLIGDKPLAVDSRHAAFTLIWKPADVPDPLDPGWINLQLQLAIEEFELRQLSLPPLDFGLMNLVIRELEDLNAPDLLLDLGELMLGRIGDTRTIEADFAAFLVEQLDIKFPELDLAFTGLGTICLEDTPIGQRLREVLDELTLGNRGVAEVEKLCLDLTSYSLTVSVTLCHKHSWGSVGDVLDMFRS